jgi:hypothetical protein
MANSVVYRYTNQIWSCAMRTKKKRTHMQLGEILERAGYKNAIDLIETELVPLAKKHHISIDAAITMYKNGAEEQDTSWYQLYSAMRQMSDSDIALYDKLDVFSPL